jgi:hypothetical protein
MGAQDSVVMLDFCLVSDHVARLLEFVAVDGSIDPTADYVTRLAAATGQSWPTLAAAREAAN